MFTGGIAGDHLRQYIERIERLEEDKANIAGDIREVYAEAKGNGFDPKIMRQIIRIRKMDNNERDEQEHLLDLYKSALGMMPTFEDEPQQAASTPAASAPPAAAPTATVSEEIQEDEMA